MRGVAQAQEKFNANGGLNRRLLEIAIANDGENPDQAKQIAQQLVKDESVLGVIGHNSSKTTQIALDVYRRQGIPVISPTSTGNTLSGNFFFRTIPSDSESGKTLAEHANSNKSDFNKVVIFYNPQSPYSNSLREEFEKNFKGDIFDNIDLTYPKLDIEKELKDSASQQVQAVILLPDVKYISTAFEIAKVNASNDLGLGLKLLGGEILYRGETLKGGGDAMEGLVIAVPWFNKAPQSNKFAESAEKYWGGSVSWRTATSFDATQAFIKAFSSKSKTSRETILQRLREINLSPEETSGDELKFVDGERESKPVLVKVEKGKFKCLQCSL